MQKKVIALAVAGALAAPALALAQDSGVVISGSIYGEYSKAVQGASASGTATNKGDPDILQTPGSNLRIRSTEKVAYGMTAWFQCESTLDFRGWDTAGFCLRNSGLGLQGDFGNVWAGNWDTPFKRSIANTGGRDTGIFGTAQPLAGNSTTVDSGAASVGVFKRRQRNLISYDTPSIGGLTGMVAYTNLNHATAISSDAAGAKARIVSSAVTYKNGPVSLGTAYDKHYHVNGNGNDATGYHVSAEYTLGSVKLGGVYTVQKVETAATTSAKVKAYLVGAEWNIAGPHNLHASYVVAGDLTGSGTYVNRGVAGANTGAKLYQVRYVNDLSKRTQASIGYVLLKQDTAANYFLGGYASTNGTGGTDSAVAVSLLHTF